MPKAQEEETKSTLPTLQQEVGKPNQKLLGALLSGTTPEGLHGIGKEIVSSRIVTDGGRIYSEAWGFYKKASPEQKKSLRGFSQPLLALAVHKLVELRDLSAQVGGESKQAGAARAVSEKDASLAVTNAIALRDQANTSLRDAVGSAGSLRQALDGAFGNADTAESLAKGLEDTARLLRTWLKQKDDADLSGRLLLANLDEEYAQELEAAAGAVRDAAIALERPIANPKATQANLDLEDGVNVTILGQIIRAFERAHDIDPTIPRLVPISTRRLFSRKSKKAKPNEGSGSGGQGGEG